MFFFGIYPCLTGTLMTDLYSASSSSDSSDSSDREDDGVEFDVSEYAAKPNSDLKDVREVLGEKKNEWTVNYYQLVRDIKPYLQNKNIIREAEAKVYTDLGLPLPGEIESLSMNQKIEYTWLLDEDNEYIDFRPDMLLKGIRSDGFSPLSEYLREEEMYPGSSEKANFNAFGPAERLFVRYIFYFATQRTLPRIRWRASRIVTTLGDLERTLQKNWRFCGQEKEDTEAGAFDCEMI